MPVFSYTALNPSGKSVSGILDADSLGAARKQLRQSELYPTRIEPAEAGGAETGWFSRILNRRVGLEELGTMTRQLASLVSANIPLVNALSVLIPHLSAKALQHRLSQVKSDMLEGTGFSAALARHPSAFPALYVNMVRAGEMSGTLDLVLNRLADILEKQRQIRNRIWTAMVYPLFLTVTGLAILIFLVAVVVPGMVQIFADMKQVLPLPTRILIRTGDFISRWGWGMVVLAIGGLAGWRRALRNEKFCHGLDRLVLRLPLIGRLNLQIITARISRTLGSLLNSGVPMLTAIEIVASVSGNRILSEAMEVIRRKIERGRPLAASLEETGLFPPLSVQMIRVGEQTGELEQMLEKVADFFDGESEARIARLVSIVEPCLILAMGLIVGFVVLSICLPIFDMNRLVRIG
ncbi:type II secretion system inner membrane protein GspF [Desulfatirhabdium butyrativorans]|uniref:type II secretion system inner membrane protein GspF n=1 Tax=Desulfatirhabdium butyrativorans TaxID=340467 RepID=UPI000404EA8F|nr:type II secretion system inner membrane protein GspF [Desulfatirhabdium butyrativorans]